jgi:hypothetical protein
MSVVLLKIHPSTADERENKSKNHSVNEFNNNYRKYKSKIHVPRTKVDLSVSLRIQACYILALPTYGFWKAQV